ncbi:sugar transferase [Dehalobacter sp. TeCB1]|uniref:sugar transferase n=1 Tax=Dehalobacter sp. TeCB1 TaxID=1843715 RepID=UPI00083B7A2F|nr:sugar transferase [Dehalobacter sp. TeCB1]OCZ49555.1 UDP-phosphate galactose phosphotransferase [Dehalobacter sp. TeCB1]
MDKRSRFAYANIIQVITDIIFLFGTYATSYFIAGNITNLYAMKDYLWILIIFAPIWILIMNIYRMYDNTTFYYLDRVFRNVLFATIFSGLIIGSMFFFIKEINTSRIFIGVFFILCLIIMFLERLALRYIFRMANINHRMRIILVCSPETYLLFKKYVRKTTLRYTINGVIKVDDQDIDANEPLLGQLDMGSFESILKKQVVDQVVFALPRDYILEIEPYMNTCMQMGITVQNVLNYNLDLARVHSSMLGPMPVLTFYNVGLNPVPKMMKRAMDILGAVVGIMITLIASVIIVPAIKLDSPGPIFFKQKRVGRYGELFDCYKFRTMCIDAEVKKKELEQMNEYKNGLFFKIEDDPRITRVGAFLRKTSLDEFPQFFNVLKGDMSLVGTRPPLLDEVAQYDIEHWRRISIKPGITGNWQINGRSSIKDFEEVVALDTQYIDKWSIWLDIMILFKTVLLVVKRESAF